MAMKDKDPSTRARAWSDSCRCAPRKPAGLLPKTTAQYAIFCDENTTRRGAAFVVRPRRACCDARGRVVVWSSLYGDSSSNRRGEIRTRPPVERVVLVAQGFLRLLRRAEAAEASIDRRLEQFIHSHSALGGYGAISNTKQLVWVQEETKNMGGWTFVEPSESYARSERRSIWTFS